MNIIRKIAYNFFYLIDEAFKRRKPLVVVLCYHNIGSDKWKFSISKSEFKRQIKYLLNNRKPINLSTFNSYLTGDAQINTPSFILTFDDGCKGVLEIADFLKSYEIKPTMFLIADPKKADRGELNMNINFLNKKDLNQLLKLGWEIGCHSLTHSDFNKLGMKVEDEVVSSKSKIEKNLGIDVNYFSFPKGRYDSKILTSVKKAKYKLAVTMDDGFINKKTNRYTIPRVGIDKTHSFSEFKATISPSSIQFRSIIKKTFLLKYL